MRQTADVEGNLWFRPQRIEVGFWGRTSHLWCDGLLPVPSYREIVGDFMSMRLLFDGPDDFDAFCAGYVTHAAWLAARERGAARPSLPVVNSGRGERCERAAYTP